MLPAAMPPSCRRRHCRHAPFSPDAAAYAADAIDAMLILMLMLPPLTYAAMPLITPSFAISSPPYAPLFADGCHVIIFATLLR